MNEQQITALVEKVIQKLEMNQMHSDKVIEEKPAISNADDIIVDDITKVDLSKDLKVDNPHNEEAYLKMKSYTPARLGVGRTGNRYKTSSVLRFRADHAAAMDAVFSMVDHEKLQTLNEEILFTKTACHDKDEYVTRPDLGKQFDDEQKKAISSYVTKKANVQIVIGDGLSSAAVEANIKDVLPSLEQGLKSYNISLSKLIFAEYCRVGAMDMISELSEADVTLLLIGERPGLVTAESMSAYIVYKGTIGMPEARRTVISNIHKGGTPAVEAGAHIAGIVKKMLDEKKSGVDLKL